MADPSRRQETEAEEYVVRAYRDFDPRDRFTAFSVRVKETDLFIRAGSDLSDQAFQAVRACREQIEEYIRRNPDFRTTLKPVHQDPGAPRIVAGMIEAARRAGVGPMAGVAGAVAEYVGLALTAHSREVIVENGGDIYLQATHPVLVGILAGRSPLSGKLGIRIGPEETPCGVCTSSGTVGPSLSFGSTDAVTVRAASAVLADAAATALGNRIRRPEEIEPVLERAGEIEGVQGVVVILGDRIGLWGNMELVRLPLGDRGTGHGPGPRKRGEDTE